MMAGLQFKGQNWCKKLNHEIDDFTVHVLCFTPCSKGCAGCPEYAYKETKIITLVYDQQKTAYDCLEVHCDYAEAAEGQFICNKPKNQAYGKATRETFSLQVTSKEQQKEEYKNENLEY
jgi:hypothetical protein